MFWFSLQRETFFILRRNERDVIRNVEKSSCKVPVIPVRFSFNLYFLEKFSKNTHIEFHENPPSAVRVVPCGRMDMAELIFSFRNFGNAPTKAICSVSVYGRFCIKHSLMLRRTWQFSWHRKVIQTKSAFFLNLSTLMWKHSWPDYGISWESVKLEPGY